MIKKLTNPNYCATVVSVKSLLPLEGCDNVVGFPMFGYQAIVSKNANVGDLGVLFTAETQLSHDFCSKNNLYRDQDMNDNKEEKGYIEQNRRVKAIKFRGHKSSALFVPLNYFQYLGIDVSDLIEGDAFNEINGVEICDKYYIYNNEKKGENKIKGKEKRFEKIDNKTMPEHLDSENYFRNKGNYKDEDMVVVTQKLHGTSGRWGNLLSKRPLRWYEKLLSNVITVSDKLYENHYGSRRVIKTGMYNKNNQDYYSTDVWGIISKRLEGKIPQDWIIYGEIIGWDGNKPIQKGYTYDLPQGSMEMYVYRIAVVNQQGVSVDLSWDAVKQYCTSQGIKHVPELRVGKHVDFYVEEWMDENYNAMGFDCVPLCKQSPCDEGVIVRREGIAPYLTKCKCATFLEHETKQLDSGEVDMESVES